MEVASRRAEDLVDEEDKTFHNRTLTIDGHRFVKCHFINADLRYKGTGPFELRENLFEGYLNIEFNRDGVDARAMAEELDQAFRAIGFDLRLSKHIFRCSWPIFRYHTLLPRGHYPGVL